MKGLIIKNGECMIDKFVPDMYVQSIYRINYKKLASLGIKLIIFDLDNTIAPVDEKEPSKEAKNLMFEIKDLGIRPILMSNSGKKRVEPFRNGLEIDSCASAQKPTQKNYEKIKNIYKFSSEQIACVGDQFLTDVLGANIAGMTSILVNKISKKDRFITLFNRGIEKILILILSSRDLFKKGKYYD